MIYNHDIKIIRFFKMHDSTDICKVVLTLIKHGMVTLAKLLIGNQSMSFSKRCKECIEMNWKSLTLKCSQTKLMYGHHEDVETKAFTKSVSI